LTWEKIRELARFHSQAHNIPVETLHLSDPDQAIGPYEGIQIVFVDNGEMPKAEELQLFLLYPHAKKDLESTSKVLEDQLPGLARQYHKKQRDQLKKLVLSGVDERKDSLRQAIQQAGYTLEDLNRRMFETARSRNLDQQMLTQLEKPIVPLRKKILDEYANIRKLVPGLYQSIQFRDRYIYAKTHRVDIEHYYDNYEIGVLLIELDLSRGQVMISNQTNTVNGYHHPHVDDGGGVCLGNISSGLTRLLGEFEIYAALELLHRFVHQYNPEDAYQKIQYWNDSDYCEDDNEYERCREGGSYGRTCVNCGDNYCPYYEGALEECQEDADLNKCVTYSDRCQTGEDLLRDCHNENPLGCMTCSFSMCPFYRKEEFCHEVNSESCQTCNVEYCRYAGVAHETADV
jgi:hypothetical protein